MSILSKDKVKLNASARDKFEAIRMAGQLLVAAGHASVEYIDKMIEREQTLSTYMGGGLAIPHGTNDSKELIRSTGLSVIQFPQGIDFGEGEKAYLVVGIAAAGDDHLDILTSVATVCSDDDNMRRILQASTEEELLAILGSGMTS
ncbi:PTS sugar transporter subunit IIA [Paenibacillus ginsengihumi]|uniref:PTS sugar transporter subunit IIA n=1 Tax=Paenibacillus ginsengihumi TaxID=431596 RepID=UPI000360B56F|nr:PTS sugar transporter subunit IIA [Paenibacillus ginsengihumi]